MPLGVGRRRGPNGSARVQRGQATVELALTLPVAVLFALVVAQAGLVAIDQLLLTHAAREAARAAAVKPDVGAARTAATGGSRLDPSRLAVQLGGGTSEGDRLTAALVYQSPTDVPIVGRFIGDVTLNAEVTVRVE